MYRSGFLQPGFRKQFKNRIQCEIPTRGISDSTRRRVFTLGLPHFKGKCILMPDSSLTTHSSIDRLKEISTWVSSVQDLDQLLELVIETATRMMDAKASSLLLLDPRTRKLYFKVATGAKSSDVKQFEIELGQGIAGHVAETGEPLLIPDVAQDSRWYKEISESIGFKTQSIACVPMKIDSEIIGVVEIIDKADGSAIRDEDLKILSVFADLAAQALGNAREIEHDKKEIKDLKRELQGKYEIVGESKALRKVISDAIKVANSKSTTLILGESGTGKELLARMIHRVGVRKDEPMIVLNCAALPETLLEDELFGHEKGAYTGAVSRKIGKFELADRGTIFLDEIGEMSPSMQTKLLRILQEGVFYRVGGNKSIPVDVRVISATNRNIEEDVAEGRFREDLYYRINVVQIQMPPLRERREDIALLADYFLDIYRKERGLSELTISPKAMNLMLQYDWPGNVREMKNALERAVVMGNGQQIVPEDLPAFACRPQYPGLEVGLSLKDAIDAFKKEFILLNLRNTNGNRSLAAKNMQIQRTYLSRLITKFDIKE
ncbi:Response regulator of zinc sigma-54-dependent two-component system [Olavius algarvensis Delta 1 endosymbiont]|nr:Response regulator of zinc sigma-54-dependent two-component system [Olavius algarvensis Delta 1 endosymbiont]